MLKLVVFDCDGVMFSSREANRAYYNDLLRAFSCPPMNEVELDFVHVQNVFTSVAYIFRNHPQVDMTEVNRYRRHLDYTPYLRHMEMEPDLPDFLRLIRPRYHTAAAHLYHLPGAGASLALPVCQLHPQYLERAGSRLRWTD